MKRRNVLGAGLFLGVFIAVSVSGAAQWRRPGSWAAPGPSLTDEQSAKIQEIRLAFQEKLLPLQLEWQKAQWNLDSLAWKGAGEKDLEAAGKTLDGIDIKIEKAYQDHRNEVRNLLNEEQKILFDRYGGLGMGLDRGMNPRWGMRQAWGRGYGPGQGLGLRQGARYGAGWGRGLGRGFFCPWFRWR